MVRAECVRQRNEVAIKLGIISLSSSLFLGFLPRADLVSDWADDFIGKYPHWLLGVYSVWGVLQALP